jgi:peptidyl-prolyl cis-trans isomerase A (cyclophilin A)
MSFRSFRHLRYPSRLIKALTNCSLRKSLAVVVLISTLAQGTLASEIVRVDTDTGSFVLEMYADIAPATVANFLSYVNSGAYENTIIHRKVTNFVIQGGGFFYNPELGDISANGL